MRAYLTRFPVVVYVHDAEVLAYNVRVEEGNRGPCTVWVTMRTSGTHTGAAFGSGPYVPCTLAVAEQKEEEKGLTSTGRRTRES